ncbi:heterokaryon incompatibility protein-domain-containing protein [Phaeosphaeria sp. MPI-PUGE-AT-0046c]|nr:heterokaryon incompatibility protein-domain-containing protein [Phaeosphaeria sp. MPI-PUGE-AT-0046c]
MWLLRLDGGGQFSLVEFTGNIPPYAILSHTWGPDSEEVTYEDIINGTGRDKIGYQKIRFCGSQASKDGLQYFWIDTCCIDKKSSAELTESINSMFEWYRRAAVCYVALGDLSPGCVLTRELGDCRWFKRGWTLQELLAPIQVQFFDSTWIFIGSRDSLVGLISKITGIAAEFVAEGRLESASVAIKMSWAAQRETKRIEDRAYSLLGIFDVNMSLIYGEGMKAFRRLQEEIIKRNNDLTIFAWEGWNYNMTPLISPIATSPAMFTESFDISQYTADFAEFSITNKGLLLSNDIPLRSMDTVTGDGKRVVSYLVYLGFGQREVRGIYLRKIGPNLFCRDGHHRLLNLVGDDMETRTYEVKETCILLNPTAALDAALKFRSQGIHVPFDTSFDLRHAYPQMLWDETDRMYLRPKRYVWADFPMVLVMEFKLTLHHGTIWLAVLCHHLSHGPVLKIFSQDQYHEEFDIISQARYRHEGIHVHELDLQARSIRAMGNTITVKVNDQYYRIAVALRSESLQTFVGPVPVSTVYFTIDGRESQRLQRV